MEDEREGIGPDEDIEVRDAQTEPLGTPAGQPPGDRPRRLLRSDKNRMLAGVAGGLADYFKVDPIIIRIGFGVSILFGGLGLVAYLALALFVPLDDGTENPKAVAQGSKLMTVLAVAFLLVIALPAIGGGLLWGDGPGAFIWICLPIAAAVAAWAVIHDRGGWGGTGRTLSVLLIALLAATAFMVLAFGAALLTAVGEGVAVALVLVAAGLLLAGLAFAGAGRWLILPVAAIGLGASAAAASDLDLGGGIGERTYEPAAVSEIPAPGYELGIGRLAVDLRQLEWRGQTIELDLDLGIGEAVVAVPERVCVVADARVGAGELVVAGDRAEGFDVDPPPASAPAPGQRPTLSLNADLDLGSLSVINDDVADIDKDRHGPGRRDDDAALRDLNRQACGR